MARGYLRKEAHMKESSTAPIITATREGQRKEYLLKLAPIEGQQHLMSCAMVGDLDDASGNQEHAFTRQQSIIQCVAQLAIQATSRVAGSLLLNRYQNGTQF